MGVLQGWGVGSLPWQREWLIFSDQHNMRIQVALSHWIDKK